MTLEIVVIPVSKQKTLSIKKGWIFVCGAFIISCFWWGFISSELFWWKNVLSSARPYVHSRVKNLSPVLYGPMYFIQSNLFSTSYPEVISYQILLNFSPLKAELMHEISVNAFQIHAAFPIESRVTEMWYFPPLLGTTYPKGECACCVGQI